MALDRSPELSNVKHIKTIILTKIPYATSRVPCGGHVNIALIEGLRRNISTQLFENRPDTFGGKYFLSSHYSHIRPKSPALCRPCFFDQSTWIEGI